MDSARTESPVDLDSSCPESLAHQQDDEVNELVLGKDPWVIANEHNLNSAGMYWLPDELAVKMMGHLSPPDLYTLQKSCRMFNRLFQGPEYDRLRMQPFMDDPAMYTWLYSRFEQYGVSASNLSFLEQREVEAILRMDSLCQPCRIATRNRERFFKDMGQPMYCGGCKQYHPEILFSPTQKLVPAMLRVCIGREGYVRICEHKAITWSDIEQLKSQPQVPGELGIKTIRCHHSSHNFSRELPQEMGRFFTSKLPSADLTRVSSSERICISLTWLIDLEQAKKDTPNATLHDLQRKLRLGQVTTGVKLCPHESLSDARFMNTVDPSRHESVLRTLSTPHSTSQCPYRDWSAPCCGCRLHGQTSFPSDPLQQARRPITHCSKCVTCQTQYIWEQLDGMATLGRKTGQVVENPCDFNWISLMDLDSYSLEEPGNRHFLWCDDPACATSMRWRKMSALEKATMQYELMSDPSLLAQWLASARPRHNRFSSFGIQDEPTSHMGIHIGSIPELRRSSGDWV